MREDGPAGGAYRLRKPISRVRSTHRDQHDILNPIPPTSSEIAATIPSAA